VGFSSLIRFPHVTFRNGGGVFLIPFFFFMVVLGVPLYLIEMGIGQSFQLGAVEIWRENPSALAGAGMVFDCCVFLCCHLLQHLDCLEPVLSFSIIPGSLLIPFLFFLPSSFVVLLDITRWFFLGMNQKEVLKSFGLMTY